MAELNLAGKSSAENRAVTGELEPAAFVDKDGRAGEAKAEGLAGMGVAVPGGALLALEERPGTTDVRIFC
jgi:hypothetical protein